jgi:hypothetical protein
VPPSSVKNINRCALPAVSEGVMFSGQTTLAGQVTVPDVCVNSKIKEYDTAEGTLLNVKVLLAAIVLVK